MGRAKNSGKKGAKQTNAKGNSAQPKGKDSPHTPLAKEKSLEEEKSLPESVEQTPIANEQQPEKHNNGTSDESQMKGTKLEHEPHENATEEKKASPCENKNETRIISESDSTVVETIDKNHENETSQKALQQAQSIVKETPKETDVSIPSDVASKNEREVNKSVDGTDFDGTKVVSGLLKTVNKDVSLYAGNSVQQSAQKASAISDPFPFSDITAEKRKESYMVFSLHVVK